MQSRRSFFDSLKPRDVELGEKLGFGAFASVYKGKYRDEVVAIKKINGLSVGAAQAYDREISAASEFSHHGIVGFKGGFRRGGNYFVVEELMLGGTLSELIKRGEPSTMSQFYSLFLPIVEGLAEMHERHFIHRDIKPDNILLSTKSHPYKAKLADFGLTRWVEEEERKRMTIVGTVLYMAPEILEELPYSFECDIFSLGVVFLEALTGKKPAMDKARNDKYLISEDYIDACTFVMKDVPDNLIALIKRMVCSPSALRPKAREIVTELKTLQKSSGGCCYIL
ncbi:hypothetical protein ADUPG1_008679 [Aduncisulcus paluster]|uniref:Protein kinase domain-containing protein n=1 Tax=Aduncisulcus paluster TaxID=2918883 RepID=A0ABQ5KU21_9EUKA|nr:hypothetical protein ADUPG1_008679 [Aduncisulcus paluster]